MEKTVSAESLWSDLEKIRKISPLVHNVTNYVAMNFSANILLALGASPVMAHAREEAAGMTRIAQSLVVNIGTLSPLWVAGMLKAANAAKRKGIPAVLDPVGAGATKYRTQTALRLMKTGAFSAIRGNASEILALGGAKAATKGVDAAHQPEQALECAQKLAAETGAVIVVSGAVDLITGKDRAARIYNGHPLMAKVTAMGCAATAVTGAFLAVNPDAFSACANAMALMGICGEIAARDCAGPGAFQSAFIDAVYNLKQRDIKMRRE